MRQIMTPGESRTLIVSVRSGDADEGVRARCDSDGRSLRIHLHPQ